jgi:hypothetical protein
MNRITRWFSTLPIERQFDIQLKFCIAMIAMVVIMLVFAWWLSNEAGAKVREVNSLYANLSENMSVCTGLRR